MIKFNLLGNNTAIDYRGKYLLVAYIVAAVIIVLHLGSTYIANKREIGTYEIQVKTLEADLSVIKKETQSVRDLESKREQLNKKLAIVARLRRSRSGVVRLLDDFNLAIPARVWIRDFSENDQVVTINGSALENQDIAQFMKRLENSDYFLTVDLVESRQSRLAKAQSGATSTRTATLSISESSSDDANINVKDFTLRARVSYMGRLRKSDLKARPKS